MGGGNSADIKNQKSAFHYFCFNRFISSENEYLKRTKLSFSVFLLCLIFTGSHSFGQDTNYEIASVPAWVNHQTLEYTNMDKSKTDAPGYYFLLVSKQENLPLEQTFVHYAVRISNAEGLREASDLKIDFDPNYQKLTLHKINLIREGKITNQLADLSINIIQRETSLERHIYDGRLTAVINLVDVRVGDIIDYSYSIAGHNPVFEGHYSSKIYLQYSVPIDHIYIRLIVPNEKKLRFTYFNGVHEPEKKEFGGNIVCVWERKYLPALLLDINTPLWYEPYPQVFVSDYRSWSSLVNWSLNLFSVNETERMRLKAGLGDIVRSKSLDSTIIRAIRFTQDEIRYLAFIDGLYTHKPHAPAQVLSQRYGDCKDKSLLLCEILKLSGIKAYPVLVHSTDGPVLEQRPTTPNAFDHCVVQLKKDGKAYYIDPTISNQGGDLEHRFFPNYHKGLVIKEGENSLTDLPVSDYASIRVRETFKVESSGKGGGTMHVSTSYKGAEADYYRQYFAGNDLQSIQKQYIDFYSILYPEIKANRPIKMMDSRSGKNTLTVTESYTIDKLWEPSTTDEQTVYCEFYPLSLHSMVDIAQSPKRSMPYLVTFPVDYEHETIIELPAYWSVQTDSTTIASESFSYTSAVDYENQTIRILHKYKTLREFVEAEKALSFIQKHNTIIDNLSYMLTYDESLTGEQFSFSWTMGSLAMIVLILSGFGAFKIYHYYDLPVVAMQEEVPQIGGWLVLVAIGLTLTPFKLVYDIFITPEYFNSNMLTGVLDLNVPTRTLLTGLLMISEIVFNLTLFVFSVLVIFLFYNRRTTFPRFVIVLYVATVSFMILDTVTAFSLNPDAYTRAEKAAIYGDISRVFLTAVIWIPYFLISKRVKRTFVKRSARSAPVTEPEVRTMVPPEQTGRTSLGRKILTALAVIFGLMVTVSILSNIGKSLRQNKSTNISRFGQDPALPGVEFPADISYDRTSSVNWKYAILQCVSIQNDVMRLRIITVTDSAEAEDIINRLHAGASFALLAMEKSTHPSKEMEGFLGFFKMEDLNVQFQAALKGIEEGEYTDIIEMAGE